MSSLIRIMIMIMIRNLYSAKTVNNNQKRSSSILIKIKVFKGNTH